MEKFLFKKIEMWLLLLLAVLAIVGTIIFAAVVRNEALGIGRFGLIGEMSLAVAEIPGTALELLQTDQAMFATKRRMFDGKSGWDFQKPAVKKFPGYLLVSRYDGNVLRHVVELLDVRTGDIVYTWNLDADQLLKGVPRQSDVLTFERWTSKYFRFINPFLMENGDLIVKDHESPLMRVDTCGNLIWRQEGSYFHHATEIDSDGDFWVSGRIEPSTNPKTPIKFRDDSIVKMSAAGELLYQKSIQEIFMENGLGFLLYASGSYQDDPMHLNDVQPVMSDGPYWKKGDVFFSLRHLSMIVLYRPSTNQVIWQQQGPWAAQHDVDIIDDTTISIFNNNAVRYSTDGPGQVVGNNEVVYYDFSTDTVSSPYKKLFQDFDIRTESEGLTEALPGGYRLVEEENVGRILLFSPTGDLIAEFVNRADSGVVYRLGWSRFITAELGDKLRGQLGDTDCGSPT